MRTPAAEISVQAYESDGLLLEQYAYTVGLVEPIPNHSHEDYQFALSLNHHGEYTYRGEVHQIPVGQLSIIHSGEVHAPSDRPALDEPAHFAMAHIHPKWLNSVAAEVLDNPKSDPFFSAVLPPDALLNHLFLELSTITLQKSSQLEQDVALWDFLSYLISRYALDKPTTSSSKPSRQAVLLARDYLRAHYSDDVSLDNLAAVAGLSRFHFCRLFRKEIGVSASTYQTQLRLAEARRLLAQGTLISETAIATGFYDQSHFGKHFKRHVGTTPAKYTSQIAISS
ncbi:transcriptional regulator, AraC family protein [Synechococcus sp. PCC 7335]|uniref:AraC family transcriptional regulator n=1 Tax=Synechococcus sp. (strain ATCC 29403 / PCC 7335) TaxID=91464 RepID=UPI00017EB1A0|nr:AraC family transcriptional regulator [Synechococcus sp. PCC 7335]EDX83222.1 transcriptional regulator, AraC family protein [Synechococcus sp. PCC 7335]